MEQDVATHLGKMKRMFASGGVDENDIEYADETHFIVNVDKGTTLGFACDEEVKYSDVVSGGEGTTILVRLSSGTDSCIEATFIIFMNKDRSYPI